MRIHIGESVTHKDKQWRLATVPCLRPKTSQSLVSLLQKVGGTVCALWTLLLFLLWMTTSWTVILSTAGVHFLSELFREYSWKWVEDKAAQVSRDMKHTLITCVCMWHKCLCNWGWGEVSSTVNAHICPFLCFSCIVIIQYIMSLFVHCIQFRDLVTNSSNHWTLCQLYQVSKIQWFVPFVIIHRSEISNTLFNMLLICILPSSDLTHPNHISCSHCFKCPRCPSTLSVQQYLVCPEEGGGTETTPAADKGRTLENVGLSHVWIETAGSAVEYEQTCSQLVLLLLWWASWWFIYGA